MTAPGPPAQSGRVTPPSRARNLCAALAALALAACGQCGTAAYAGMTTWEDGTSSVRVRYLEAPWHVRGGDLLSTLELEVDPVTGPDSGVPPKYLLTAAVTAGSAAGVLAADRAAAPARGEVEVPMGTVTITTDSGDHGIGFVGMIAGLFGRSFLHVAYDVPGSRVLHIVIEANVDPRTPELLAMLRAVDVAPFSP